MTANTTGASQSFPIRAVVEGELRSLSRNPAPAPVASSATLSRPPASAITNAAAPCAGVSPLDLAAQLGTTVDRLTPLLEFGYLTRLPDGSIEPPPESAMHWLRGMFAPIYLRPMLELEQAAEVMGVSLGELRTVALDHNIQLHSDPAFGFLISVVGFHRLHRALIRSRRPMRFDRQAMMGILAIIRQIEIPTAEKGFTLPYHERLEIEIRRICRLPEPERTARACAFYEAYMDAKTMTDCLEKYHAAAHPVAGKESMLNQRVTNMARRYGGEMAIVDADCAASECEPSSPGPEPSYTSSDSFCEPSEPF